MMKLAVILMLLVSLMMTSYLVHRVPQPAKKILITAQPKPEQPKPEPGKQTITYRMTIIIKEVVVDNVEDVERMLPKDKKQEKQRGGLLLAD